MSKNYVYISKRLLFCAAHKLESPFLSAEENKELYDKCNRMNFHGHSYELVVTLRGEIDPKIGIVMNYSQVKRILKSEIYDKVDHYNLNVDVDFLKDIIVSAENLCIVFWDILKAAFPENIELYEVRIAETENNVAFYRGGH